MRKVLWTFLVMALFSNHLSAFEMLTGCKDPQQLTNLVETLATTKWEQLNSQKIQRIWPEQLEEKSIESLDLGPDKSSMMLTHKGRFSDWCECCETFQFELQHKSDGTIVQRLTWVTIFHTEHDLAKLIDMAQRLLIQIVPAEREKILLKDKWELDKTSDTLYHIYRTEKKLESAQLEFNGADVQISKQAGNWTMYLSFFIGAVDPINKQLRQ